MTGSGPHYGRAGRQFGEVMAESRRLPTIAPLTGLRAFAAAWVVLYHFRVDIEALAPSLRRVGAFFDAGYAGVDIFFILSGFIISYTYLDGFRSFRPRTYVRFLWLRLARIYPVQLFTLAIFTVIVVEGGWTGVRGADILANVRHDDFWRQLLLVHAWGADGNHAWNYPAWSISSEWFAYLLFPVAALGLARVGSRGPALIGLAGALALNALIYILIAAADKSGQVILPRIIGEFGAGCFLFLLWRGRWLEHAHWGILTPALAIGAGAVTVAVARDAEFAPVAAAPLYAMTIYGLAMQRDALSRLLGASLLVYAGEASYALYMTHAVVQRFVWEYLPAGDYVTDGRLVRGGILFSYALLLTLAAIFTYEFVEQPARGALRNAVRRKGDPLREPQFVPGPEAPWLAVSQPAHPDGAPYESRRIG